MNRAVVHAVASLFGHNRLLSIFFSPSLAGSLAESAVRRACHCTLFTMCGRFTETAAFDVLAERFGIADVLPCLRPLPVERMEIYPVSTLVSSLRNEGAQLVEPVIVYTKAHEQPK